MLFILTLGVPVRYAKKVRAELTDTQFLPSSWILTAPNNASERYQNIDKDILNGKKNLRLTYNLHGICLLGGDASAVVFDQQGWKYISLANYGKNCYNGDQTTEIPLSDFRDISTGEKLATGKPLDGTFHVRFWLNQAYSIIILNAVLVGENSDTADTPSTIPVSSDTPLNLTTGIRGITDGETVKNMIFVAYQADPKSTKKIDFYIDNDLKTTENKYPYYLGGDNNNVNPNGWNTEQLGNGKHLLKIIVTDKNDVTKQEELNFTVDNTKENQNSVSIDGVAPTISTTPTPIVLQTPTSTPSPVSTSAQDGNSWEVRSIDAMKDTKDAICSPKPQSWIERWVDKAAELGANYVAISTPYESPLCGNSVEYTKMWIKVIRAKGLKVWHRQMPLSFEGIYNTVKSASGRNIDIISSYIKNNPDNFQPGDIFTPVPEPQNGGIAGVTYCANGYCQFSDSSDFNTWLRTVITGTERAFTDIGMEGKLKIGYFGFDGFVAWGANNPDWHGILEDSTVQAMGNITIDHYPEAIGSTMKQGLDELQARYPDVPIVIGEWGTIQGGNVEQQVKDTMGAAKRPGVVGFNYWQFGPAGAAEQLINEDFSAKEQFDEVQAFYK